MYSRRQTTDWDYSIQTYVKLEEGLTEEEIQERQTWAELCWKYINQMPRAKVETLMSAVQWDLLTQKSSRRKGGPRKGSERKMGVGGPHGKEARQW